MARLYKKSSEETNKYVNEPAIACQKMESYTDKTMTLEWNPNTPFHGTQDDWLEHFYQIEKENFTPLTTANQEFAEWKTKLLANQL